MNRKPNMVQIRKNGVIVGERPMTKAEKSFFKAGNKELNKLFNAMGN